MSEQTNQITNQLTRLRLPRRVRANLASIYSAPSNEPLYCPTTRRIVLVSAVPGVVHELVRTLSDACFDVMVFHRWEPEVQRQLAYDLLIYDMSLMNSRAEIEEMRQHFTDGPNGAPLLYLVKEELAREADMLQAFEEMLVWPAAPGSTVQEVEQLLIRNPATTANQIGSSRTVFKELWVDRDKMTVYKADQQLNLTKTEYDLLLMLIEARGRVISREQMMHDIWDTDFVGGSNVVDVHVKSLRKKLGDRPSTPEYITTVRGVGYRLAD